MSPNQIGRHDPRSENTKDLKVEDIEVNVEKINEKEGKDKNTPLKLLNLLNTPTTSSSSPCEEKPSSSDNSMKNSSRKKGGSGLGSGLSVNKNSPKNNVGVGGEIGSL